MLGRLGMTVEQCIDEYLKLSQDVFKKETRKFWPVSFSGTIRPAFDAAILEARIKDVIAKYQEDAQEDALMYDVEMCDDKCKVFVCAMSQAKVTVRLRSYKLAGASTELTQTTKIWEAGRATSAATSFFAPIKIGRTGEEFVDGALGANNPVAELWDEARRLWPDRQLEDEVGCLLSLGTGLSALKAFDEKLKNVWKTLVELSTDTVRIEKRFAGDHSDLAKAGQYLRLDVIRGLETVGLESAEKMNIIKAMTDAYFDDGKIRDSVALCIQRGHETLPDERLTLPSTRNQVKLSDSYVCRITIMADIRARLPNSSWEDPAGPVLLHGLPGCGKTQLSKGIAHEYGLRNICVWICDASSAVTLHRSYFRFLLATKSFDEAILRNKDVEEISSDLEDYLDKFQEPVLFIFDNYDAIANEVSYQLSRLIPKNPQSQILITSRNGSAITLLQRACQTVPVKDMSNTEAIHLLKALTQDDSSQDADGTTEDLYEYLACNLLGNFPLAIGQAGAYIRKHVSSCGSLSNMLRHYADIFNTHAESLLSGTDGSVEPGYRLPVIVTFNLAFDAIKLNKNESLEDFLCICGILYHRNAKLLWFELAHAHKERLQKSWISFQDPRWTWMKSLLASNPNGTWDTFVITECIRILADYDLLQIHPSGMSWDMHPLINVWTLIFNKRISAERISLRFQAVAAILAETYEKLSANDDGTYTKTLKLDLHEHIDSWLTKSQRHTNLLSRASPSLSIYTLSRLTELMSQDKLSPLYATSSYLPALQALALKSGLDNEKAISRRQIYKISQILAALCESISLPADKIQNVYNDLMNVLVQSPFPPDEEDERASDQLYNLFGNAVCLGKADHYELAVEKMAEAVESAESNRPKLKQAEYFTLKGLALRVVARSSKDVVRKSAARTTLHKLTEEAVIAYGTQHALSILLISTLESVRSTGADSNVNSTPRSKPWFQKDDNTPQSVYSLQIQSAARQEIERTNIHSLSVLPYVQELKSLAITEYGTWHPEVFDYDHMSYSIERWNLGFSDDKSCFYKVEWESKRRDLVLPLEWLLLMKARKEEINLVAYWVGLSTRAHEIETSEQNLEYCASILSEAADQARRNGNIDLADSLGRFCHCYSTATCSKTLPSKGTIVQAYKSFEQLWTLLNRLENVWLSQKLDHDLQLQLIALAQAGERCTSETVIYVIVSFLYILVWQHFKTDSFPMLIKSIDQLHEQSAQTFGSEHMMTWQSHLLKIFCRRCLGRHSQADALEDILIKSSYHEAERTQSGIDGTQSQLITALYEDGHVKRRLECPASCVIERLCWLYSRCKLNALNVRIYEGLVEEHARDHGYLDSKALQYIFLIGSEGELAEGLSTFNRYKEVILLSLTEESTSLEQYTEALSQIGIQIETCLNAKAYRTVILFSERFQQVLNSKGISEEDNSTGLIALLHWNLLKHLRRAYRGLGYATTAKDLAARQHRLEGRIRIEVDLPPEERQAIKEVMLKDQAERQRELLVETQST